MKFSIRQKRIAGITFFFLGLLLGLIFHAMTSWADFEAFLFDTSLSADRRLNTLRCPSMISPSETGVVSARFKNSLDRPARLSIRMHSTKGMVTLLEEKIDRVEFQPGESKQLQWEILPENAAYARVVLVRVYQFRLYPLYSYTGTCGVLVINFLGLPGAVTTAVWVIFALVMMASGAYLWASTIDSSVGRGKDDRYAVVALGLLVSAGMAASLLGQWIIAAGLLIVVVLAIVVILAALLMQ
jgi:hypothetical protein